MPFEFKFMPLDSLRSAGQKLRSMQLLPQPKLVSAVEYMPETYSRPLSRLPALASHPSTFLLVVVLCVCVLRSMS